MSYRIVYPGEEPACAKPAGRPDRLRLLTAAFLLLFTLGVRQFWPAGTEILRRWLLPGTHSVQPALDAFTGQLAQGVPFGEAIAVFHESGG